MPRLALFDVDGTLFLTHDELAGKATVAALREVYGAELPPEAIEQVDHRGQTAKRIARELLLAAGLEDDVIDGRLDEWCGRFSGGYLDLVAESDTSKWKGRPGAQEALTSLEESGVRLALLTGNPEPVARVRMERLGLARFFPPGQGAFGCEAEDRVDLIRLALQRAGVAPDQAVAVGDTPRDVSSAHQAGLRVIVIRSPRAADEQVRGADAIVDDLGSLARALLALA